MKPVRTYQVTVSIYGSALYSARSPGKAFARAFRDFGNVAETMKFAEFMKIARLRRVRDPAGCGERILVNGETVTRCYGIGSPSVGIYYMRDDDDQVLVAHPVEVEFPTKKVAA